MTQQTDQLGDLVQQSQEAFKNAVDTWTKTVQDSLGAVSAPAPFVQVDPQQVVDQVFGFAEQMLAMQHEFTRNLVQSSVALQQSLVAQGDADSVTEA